jgi:hypothetical protein
MGWERGRVLPRLWEKEAVDHASCISTGLLKLPFRISGISTSHIA